mgnify:CR=1 FL=1
MKIDVLTLFPNMFTGILEESIIKRAIEASKVEIFIHDIRSFTTDKHNRVDDYPFGGGEGMVLMPEPIYHAIESVRTKESIVIMLSPQGKVYNQKYAYKLSKEKHIILLCGHYEGFDERIRSMVDVEISVGDYIVTGGEIPSMILIDSIVRLIDGVIAKKSHENDSFNHNMLDYPVYTKPVDFMGQRVPDVLLSGHHKNIENWRAEQSLKRTIERRPDLLERDD